MFCSIDLCSIDRIQYLIIDWNDIIPVKFKGYHSWIIIKMQTFQLKNLNSNWIHDILCFALVARRYDCVINTFVLLLFIQNERKNSTSSTSMLCSLLFFHNNVLFAKKNCIRQLSKLINCLSSRIWSVNKQLTELNKRFDLILFLKSVQI